MKHLKCPEKILIKHAAFTLLELLIVIAVISLLASILLPAMGKVKAKAKMIYCANNMKQTGQGIYMYAGDFNGFLAQPLNWAYDMREYVGMDNATFSVSNMHMAPSVINKTNIFFCSSARQAQELTNELFRFSYDITTCNTSLSGTKEGGYCVYYDGVSVDGPGLYVSKQIVKVLSNSVIITEFYRGWTGNVRTRYHSPWYTLPENFNKAWSPDYCHTGSANILLGDAGVKAVRQNAYIDGDWIPAK